MSRASWFSVCCVVLAVFASQSVSASCCSSLATNGVGRLLLHERALVEMGLSTRLNIGSFDGRAVFSRRTSSNSPYLKFEPELAAMVRLFDHLEPFVKIPVRIQKSNVRVGANVADITLGARVPLVRENFFQGLPALSVILSASLPSGVSDPNLAAEEISGLGQLLYSLSLSLEKELFGINFGAGYGFSIEHDQFKKADAANAFRKPFIYSHSPSISAAFSPHEGGSLSVACAMQIHGKSKLSGDYLPDTDRRKMTTSLAYMVGIHSHLKINAQVGTDLPFNYLGKNFPSETFIRIGLRFGVF